MVDPAALAAERRAYVVAAAGCGKTELIADAAGLTPGRSLVLTHTHAGVGALRARLDKKHVPRDLCSVETLTGFALRFAASYPVTSGWLGGHPSNDDWPAVQQAATRWLATPAAEQVLAASYDGVYVDEYQDCTASQHRMVCQIAEFLPTRLLGDPLQGIFGFAGDPLDWELVYESFAEAGVLETPHRWTTTNPALGEWLADARRLLLDGEEPDWSAGVVVARAWSDAAEIDACKRLGREESVVAIRKRPSDEYRIASMLGGSYVSIEPIASQALFDAVARLEDAQTHELALATLDVAATCMTRVGARFKAARGRLEKGQLPVSQRGSPVEGAVAALRAVVEHGVGQVAEALEAIEAVVQVPPHRVELLVEIKRAIRSRVQGSERSLKDIAWDLRDDARRRGRRVPARVVSRTLLVKGLEFDHALVLKRKELPREDLYVAITRPRKSLTVLL
jgi:hypothetical protein